MINRRSALAAIAVAALGGVRPLIAGPFPFIQSSAAPVKDSTQHVSDDVESRLRADLDQLAKRAYSEDGVPVFLACVDLAPGKNGACELTAFNASLAKALRENAAAWQHIRPNAPATDISQLVEVLANRDFAQEKL
jgi:hypothetical protein